MHSKFNKKIEIKDISDNFKKFILPHNKKNEFFSVQEVAKLLGYSSLASVYNLVKQGYLRSIKIKTPAGRRSAHWFFKKDIEEYLKYIEPNEFTDE